MFNSGVSLNKNKINGNDCKKIFDRTQLSNIPIILTLSTFYCSCNGKEDDIYRPCFDCEGFTARQVYGDDFDDATEFHLVDRQTAERFQATRQSRRLLCRQGANGEPICKLRVNRAMQLRNESYRRVLEFVHAEQYLSQEDIDILFRYLNRV